MSDYSKERIQELENSLRSWKNSYYDLKSSFEDRISYLSAKLSEAEYRVSEELEPRLQTERRSYDSWVTSGGSDECFRNGMNGNCGFTCTTFGSKLECDEIFNGMSDEDLLKAYEEGYEVENEIDKRDLNIKKWLLDIRDRKIRYNIKKTELKKLKRCSLEYKYILQEIPKIIRRKLTWRKKC